MLAQRAHRRQRVQLPEPAREAADLLLDDLLRARHLALAAADVARHDGLQVVDVIEAHAVELRAGGIDVARHRDIDQQQRAPLALAHHQLELLALDDGVG